MGKTRRESRITIVRSFERKGFSLLQNWGRCLCISYLFDQLGGITSMQWLLSSEEKKLNKKQGIVEYILVKRIQLPKKRQEKKSILSSHWSCKVTIHATRVHEIIQDSLCMLRHISLAGSPTLTHKLWLIRICSTCRNTLSVMYVKVLHQLRT